MALVGYARVSTTGQTLDVQLQALHAAGCEKVYSEKRSGLDGRRPELAKCIDYVREGDVLMVTKLDRLARSTSDLYATVERLKAKGVGFKCLDNRDMDTTTKTGKLLLGVLALIAEFETDIRKERQLEGIAKAKERGVRFGRHASVTPEQVEQMKQRRLAGVLIKDIQAEFRLSKAHVYRLLDGVNPAS